MKKVILLAAIALATAAWAQDEKKGAPPAEPKPAAEAVQPGAEAATPSVEDKMKPAPLAKKSRRHQDARHCLAKGSNTEIIKCAEAYL
jgi:hypothetical protein